MKISKLIAVLVTGTALFASACGSTTDTAVDEVSSVNSEASTEDNVAVETPETVPVDDTELIPTDDSEPVTDQNAAATSGEEFPEITGVEAAFVSDGTWTIDVTVSSPYDSPERFADAWRVLDEEGNELGVRELAHDHANEQPFTRDLTGVEIPEDVTKIEIEGRDSVNGWGGQTFLYTLPGSSSY